jgi:hypothetical protein
MKVYTYNTIEEFEDAYQDIETLVEHSKTIVEVLSKAVGTDVKEVDFFQIDINDTAEVYTIKAKRSEWISALESCLSHMEKYGLVDEVIDTYSLIQKLKTEK